MSNSSFLKNLGEATKPKRPQLAVVAKTTDATTPYGQAVLDKQIPEMAAAPESMRDATLLRLGRLIGGFIGGGEIAYDDGHDEMRAAALATGLPEWEVDGKLPRHLEYGAREPLAAPDDWTPGKPVTVPDQITMRDKALSRSELRNLPRPKPLIAGMLNQGSTALLYGKWGTAKSFIALDWACSLATGKTWQSCAVQQSRVLYVAAEGVFGYQARVDAWEVGWKTPVTDEWLSFYPEPINISVDRAVDELCEFVSYDCFDVIVLDTMARCTVGTDENSAREVGVVIDALGRIRDATPGRLGTVLGVHHSGKDGVTLRGSSSYESGVDTVFQVTRGTRIKLANTKQKDQAEAAPHYLKLAHVPGTDSCVLDVDRNREPGSDEPTARGAVLAALSEHPTGKAKTKEVMDAVAYYGEPPAETGPPFHHKTIERSIRDLIADGAIVKVQDGSIPYLQLAGFAP